MTEQKRYHFEEQRTSSAIRGNMSTYAKLQQWFSELQPYFLKAGYVVSNCNPNSKLKAFPYLPYAEALAASLGLIGDAAAERTEGMYLNAEQQQSVHLDTNATSDPRDD